MATHYRLAVLYGCRQGPPTHHERGAGLDYRAALRDLSALSGCGVWRLLSVRLSVLAWIYCRRLAARAVGSFRHHGWAV